jgi:hypothetical protein
MDWGLVPRVSDLAGLPTDGVRADGGGLMAWAEAGLPVESETEPATA